MSRERAEIILKELARSNADKSWVCLAVKEEFGQKKVAEYCLAIGCGRLYNAQMKMTGDELVQLVDDQS